MSKKLAMSAFIGSGFDIETSLKQINHFWTVNPHGSLKCESELNAHPDTLYRPRLNKPQVLDDYSKVLIDGLVYEYRVHNYKYCPQGTTLIGSYSQFKGDVLDDNNVIEWCSVIGLEDKPEWREESERLAMPLIKVEG